MHIKKVSLKNFKQFRQFSMTCDDRLNILIGDNETGKSTLLDAIDLVLRGSRYAVETLGLENLFNREVIHQFLAGPRALGDLPEMRIELFFDETLNIDLNGRANSTGDESNGLKLVCRCDDRYHQYITQHLQAPNTSFPFEFYTADFSTFRGGGYSGSLKPVRHLLIDTSRISQAHADQSYVRSVFESKTTPTDRAKFSLLYREKKDEFNQVVLGDLNATLEQDAFKVRTDSKANLEADLTIYRESVPIFNRGKGMQNLLKVKFGLSKSNGVPGVVLLEEPESHLGYRLMQEQIESISSERHADQLFLTTHNSRITSRLGMRHCRMLTVGQSTPAYFQSLPQETSDYFMKAPDSKALEFLLAPKLLLVEGHAEFILMDKLYTAATGASLSSDGVHVIAIGGKHFSHYMELAKIVKSRVAVIMDNDGDHVEKCATRFSQYSSIETMKMFYETDNELEEFEHCMEHLNKQLCADLFGSNGAEPRRFMLNNKTDAAMKLLTHVGELVCPGYIQEALAWVRLST